MRIAIVRLVPICATVVGLAACSSAPGASDLADTVVVRLGERHQTMLGWEAVAQTGEMACDPRAVERYRDELLDRTVGELGLNRIRVELRSGVEKRGPNAPGDDPRYSPQNDNDDPHAADPSAFHFEELDRAIERTVVPLRDRLARRGEHLYVNLTYVDFSDARRAIVFGQMKGPEEYAELMHATFVHLRDRFGWVPDAIEAVLEPEHTSYTPEDIGRAIVVAGDRLKAAGFTPDFIAPSTTSMANAVRYWDVMMRVPRVSEYVRELSYHRYAHRSRPVLREIAARARSAGVRSAMLEHIGSEVDDLLEDVTLADASSWQQYALAFCHAQGGPDDGTAYYSVDQSNPVKPLVDLTRRAKLLSQVFRHVRAGSVRVGADSQRDLAVAAFVDPKSRVVVVLRARRGANAVVRGLPAGRYAASYATPERTGIDLRDIDLAADSTARVRVPAGAVLTLHGRE